MVDVFVSYKQEEREAVQIIASTLADLKLVIWFDTKLRAGGSFDEEIAAALRAANAVLVCWTPAAIQSEWVRAEATDGLNKNRLAACFPAPDGADPPLHSNARGEPQCLGRPNRRSSVDKTGRAPSARISGRKHLASLASYYSRRTREI